MCLENVFQKSPRTGQNPQNIPHFIKTSHFGGKVGFMAFLLTYILVMPGYANNTLKIPKIGKKIPISTALRLPPQTGLKQEARACS